MNTIGLRASPSEVTYAVYDADSEEIKTVDCLIYPKAMETPLALKYIRNTILDIIREYNVSRAGIRVMETTAKSPSAARIQIEGVIQEALASSTVESYYCGRIANISAKIGIPRDDFKKYVGKELNYSKVENWQKHSVEEKEAIFTALGAAENA